MALPQSRTTGEPAERGNIIHSFCRITTVDKSPETRERALADVKDDKIRNTCAGIDLDAALAGLEIVACERAYVLNVKDRTVRIAGDNIERHYNKALIERGLEPLGKYDVPATIDVVAMSGVIPVELDYKSGQSIGPIKEHWQRKICATALMIHYGTSTAISRVAYIGEDGSVRPDGDEFSCMDIDDFCDTIVEAIDAIEVAKAEIAERRMPTVYPSDTACKYCPAMTSCPYHMNVAKSMLGKLKDIHLGPDLESLSPEELGAVWTMLKEAEAIITPTLKSLKLYADTTTIPVGEGYEIRGQYKSRKYFNDSKARGLISVLLAKDGMTEEQIATKLAELHGETQYKDFRRLKVL